MPQLFPRKGETDTVLFIKRTHLGYLTQNKNQISYKDISHNGRLISGDKSDWCDSKLHSA